MEMRSHKSFASLFAILFLIVADASLWAVILRDRAYVGGNELYFFDVGQGDGQLVLLSGGEKVLIDGGPTGAVLDGLGRVLSPLDRRIDVVMMTHPQLDHFAGLIEVLNLYDVGVFVGSGRVADVEAYRELREALMKNEVPYVQMKEGDAIMIGDARLDILGPSDEEVLSGELNDSSLVALLTVPEFKALYTGDIGFMVEERLVRDYDIDVDVLKVGHHGSRFSSGEVFLKEITPAISVIGVGKNTYGHPTKTVLDNLLRYGSRIFRTDTDGLIKIEYVDGALVVSGEKSDE